MTSKLEYLQRYMSSGSGSAEEQQQKKKKRKSKKSDKKAQRKALGTRVVDEDHEWEQDAPSRDAIEHAWELDGGQEDLPVVVAEGDDVVEPQDLPIYVNAEEFLGELQAKSEAAAKAKTKDEDLSPPRKPQERRGSEDNAPSPPRRPRRQRAADSEDDLSPPRKRKDEPSSGGDSDASPPRAAARRRSAREEDSDASSPPRRPKQASPGRKERGGWVSHNEGKAPSEPARDTVSRRGRDRERRLDSMGRDIAKREAKTEEHDASPPRRRRPASNPRDTRGRSRSKRRRSSSRSRHPSHERGGSSRRSRRRESSASPPRRPRDQQRDRPSASHRASRSRSASERRRSRRGRRSPSPSSGSPPRRLSERSRHESGRPGSSSRRHQRSHSRSPARRKSSTTDVSAKKETSTRPPLPREESRASPRPKTTKERRNEPEDPSPPVRAGLFTATEFAQNQKAAARSKDLLQSVDAADMGANAETVYRDKRGRKLDMLNEMMRQQEVVEGKRKREAAEEYEWGTGKVQKQERRSQQELLRKMQQQPFARHEDDEELERMRKERVRAFDPMHSKLFKEDAALYGDADSTKTTTTKKEKTKKTKKKSSKPSYAGPPAPPNRFGIRPGYRWDGVVRGTGWEEKLLLRENASAATSDEMYKYAVADM